jgi:hypothetical protein
MTTREKVFIAIIFALAALSLALYHDVNAPYYEKSGQAATDAYSRCIQSGGDQQGCINWVYGP